MRRTLLAAAALSTAATLSGCGDTPPQRAALFRAPALSDTVDGVVWEAGDWTPHLPAGSKGTSWGNHRAVVEVDASLVQGDGVAEAVAVTILWRRHDRDPSAKSVVVLDAATGEPVADALALRVENASGDVAFRPNPGSTVYHVYYMPWESTGGYYPTVTYPDLAPKPDRAWAERVAAGFGDLPRARTTRIQSVDAFHLFFPMEVIATPEEEAAFMDGAPQGWRVVAEHRDRSVRMKRFIPRYWAVNAPSGAFTFQVALVAGE